VKTKTKMDRKERRKRNEKKGGYLKFKKKP
jgi:hypothetical protein